MDGLLWGFLCKDIGTVSRYESMGNSEWCVYHSTFIGICAETLTHVADNWALYALATYVRQVLDHQEYLWFPLLDLADGSYYQIAQPLKTVDGIDTFSANESFSMVDPMSQLSYDVARYQKGNEVGFAVGLSPDRTADISNTSWRQKENETGYPTDYFTSKKAFYDN